MPSTCRQKIFDILQTVSLCKQHAHVDLVRKTGGTMLLQTQLSKRTRTFFHVVPIHDHEYTVFLCAVHDYTNLHTRLQDTLETYCRSNLRVLTYIGAYLATPFHAHHHGESNGSTANETDSQSPAYVCAFFYRGFAGVQSCLSFTQTCRF